MIFAPAIGLICKRSNYKNTMHRDNIKIRKQGDCEGVLTQMDMFAANDKAVIEARAGDWINSQDRKTYQTLVGADSNNKPAHEK